MNNFEPMLELLRDIKAEADKEGGKGHPLIEKIRDFLAKLDTPDVKREGSK